MGLVEALLTWPVRRPRVAAGVAVVLTLATLPFLPRLQVNNGLEVWLDRSGAGSVAYRELLQSFGSEELILVIYELPAADPEATDLLARLAHLRRRLETLSGVRRVQDLSGIRERFFATTEGAAFWREVRASPLYRNLLVSEDGRLAATRVLLERPLANGRAHLVATIRETAGTTLPERDVRLAGPPVLNVALDQASRRASKTFFPLVFVVSGLLLGALFRRIAAVWIPFLSVGAGVVWTLGLLAATGHELNMVTVALPPVLWVLGLSTSVHLLVRSRQRQAAGESRKDAVAESVGDLARPCFISALTTALGFASLTLASMEPVREMGLFGSLGVLACLVANFLLFPFLAHHGDLGVSRSPRPGSRLTRRWVDRLQRRPWPVLLLSGALAVLFVTSMARLEADSNVVDFLRPDTPVATTYREVLPRLTGPYSLEVLLDTGPRPSAEELRRIDRLTTSLAERSDVARVVSPLDLVKATDQVFRNLPPDTFRLPEHDGDLRTAWDLTGSLLVEERRELFDPERGVLRLSVLARPMGAAGHRQLVEGIRNELETEAPEAWHPRITGVVDLLVRMQEQLLTSQIRSFAAAFLWITPVLALLLGSLRDAALSLGPNLFPIVVALGALGLAGRPLDPATMMVAGVAFGIAVDDTIHVLTAYRRNRRERAFKEALVRTLDTVGRPVVLTSLIAGLGFAVLTFSDFTPLLRFGVLTVVTLGAALFGDLVLLPALLAVTDQTAVVHKETRP